MKKPQLTNRKRRTRQVLGSVKGWKRELQASTYTRAEVFMQLWRHVSRLEDMGFSPEEARRLVGL